MGRVLVVNAGSTSLKLSLVDRSGEAEPVASLDADPGEVDAVAHRVVHGGMLREPVLLDEEVERILASLAELAPLHNTPALEAIGRAQEALPESPHVAVFDTAFHATLPAEAATFAVPRRWREEWGIRRYGFHGLSVEWASARVPVRRLVVCHLGGGCSVTAVLDGRSVDTTMGFSPRDGIPMATRSGSLDVEIVLHLLRRRSLTLDQVGDVLDRRSGLLGLSGLSSHVEELERAGTPEAGLALEVFTYRIACAVGAAAVALGGLDAIVFTAGVGEHSAGVRSAVCTRLGFLGVEVDRESNANASPDIDVAARTSAVRVVVLRAREDVVAAGAVRRLLGLAPQSPPEPLAQL